MGGEYRTVFEGSYFSNGCLRQSVIFLCVGMGILTIGLILPWISKRMNLGYKRSTRFAFLWIFGPFFILIGCIMGCLYLSDGRKFTSALANNQCDVVEGTVQVLHGTGWGGHDPKGGDHIRIGDKDFIYSDWDSILGYNRTISHGGELKNGVVARLHYVENERLVGNEILKVEIKQ